MYPLLPLNIRRFRETTMSKMLCLLACLLLTACILAGSHHVTGAENVGGAPDFSGKFLIIESVGGSGAALLSEVRLRELGGRQFLVGKSLSEIGAARIWTPVDNISRIAEFDKVDDATKFMRVPQ